MVPPRAGPPPPPLTLSPSLLDALILRLDDLITAATPPQHPTQTPQHSPWDPRSFLGLDKTNFRPWLLRPIDLENVAKYNPTRPDDAVTTLRAFYYSGYQVPCLAIFALYLAFLGLLLPPALCRLAALVLPRRWKHRIHAAALLPEAVRTHILDSPLSGAGGRHHQPLYWRPFASRRGGPAAAAEAAADDGRDKGKSAATTQSGVESTGDPPLPRPASTSPKHSPSSSSSSSSSSSPWLRSASLSMRLPLRGQSLLIGALLAFNLVLLTSFYWIVPASHSTYYPDPRTNFSRQFLRYLADRSSILALGQVPLVFLTGGRVFPLPILTGLDYSTSMVYHRWVARMAWFQANVHAAAWTIIVLQKGLWWQRWARPYWYWGAIAFAMFWGLCLLSVREVRNLSYEVFVAAHVALAAAGVVGTYLHIDAVGAPKFALYLFITKVTALLWAFDRLWRALDRIRLSLHVSLRRPRHALSSTTAMVAHASIHPRVLVEAHVDNLPAGIARVRVVLPRGRVRVRVRVRERSPLGDSGNVHEQRERQREAKPPDASSRIREPPATGASRQIGAGESVRLMLPCVQAWSDHPFTVVRTGLVSELEEGREGGGGGGDGGEDGDGVGKREGADLAYIEMLVKREGGFTRRLAELAEDGSAGAGTPDVEEGRPAIPHTRQFSAILEGPYGHFPDHELEQANDVLLFAGGIGVTYLLPMLELVWTLRDVALVQAVAHILLEVSRRARIKGAGPHISITVHHTGRGCDDEHETKAKTKTKVPATTTTETTPLLPSKAHAQHTYAAVGSPPSSSSRNCNTAYTHAPHEKPHMTAFKELASSLRPEVQLELQRGRPELGIGEQVRCGGGGLRAEGDEDEDEDEEQEHEKRLLVAVCGPAALCDAVRGEVKREREGQARVRRRGDEGERERTRRWDDVAFVEECFDW